MRAATRALPKPDEILALVRQRFDSIATRLPPSLKANVQRHRLELVKISGKLTLQPIIHGQNLRRKSLDDLSLRRFRAISQRVQSLKDKLSSEAKLFAALNYTSVLARGFAVVLDAKGQPVKLAASVAAGQNLKIRFADDTLDVTARKKTTQGELF